MEQAYMFTLNIYCTVTVGSDAFKTSRPWGLFWTSLQNLIRDQDHSRDSNNALQGEMAS